MLNLNKKATHIPNLLITFGEKTCIVAKTISLLGERW